MLLPLEHAAAARVERSTSTSVRRVRDCAVVAAIAYSAPVWCMSRRFGAAVFSAMALHAALICVALLPRRSEAPRRLELSVVARASEIEVSILTEDDGASRERSDQTSSTDAPSDGRAAARAKLAQLREPSRQTGSTPDAAATLDEVSAPDGAAELAQVASDAEQEGSSDGASDAPSGERPRINLGLDGSVLRQATLAGRERPPRAKRAPRRPPLILLGHWSEGPVRMLAQKSAPPDGQALLTLEWDSKGQLVSVRSSAASSRSDDWQRLAQGLSSQLAARPNTGAPAGGLRVVYLVKSDLVLPENKRSLLPSAKYASAEQLREKNLPPATAINLGIKADNSAATTRAVSVELVRSDAL